MHCAKCDTKVVEEAEFCFKCGTKLKTEITIKKEIGIIEVLKIILKIIGKIAIILGKALIIFLFLFIPLVTIFKAKDK